MQRIVKRSLALAAISVAAAWAGALTLEVGSADGNAEAKGMHAALVARVTACHEPAKSTVTASVVQWRNGGMERTPLKVVPLTTAGSFAIVGAAPEGSVIDLAVSNPEYKNYQPRVLIRSDSHGVQLTSMRRFYSVPPTDADVKSILGASD